MMRIMFRLWLTVWLTRRRILWCATSVPRLSVSKRTISWEFSWQNTNLLFRFVWIFHLFLSWCRCRGSRLVKGQSHESSHGKIINLSFRLSWIFHLFLSCCGPRFGEFVTGEPPRSGSITVLTRIRILTFYQKSYKGMSEKSAVFYNLHNTNLTTFIFPIATV